MAQTAVDQARSSAMLNANLPVGAAGVPGTALAAFNAGAMKLKITNTASSGSASGTDIGAQTGYAANGMVFVNQCTASSAGSNVTMPATAAMTLTATGVLSCVSIEITDNVGSRGFFGNLNGQPIAVAIGNSLSFAVASISAGGF
jgi:hypothetical protein